MSRSGRAVLSVPRLELVWGRSLGSSQCDAMSRLDGMIWPPKEQLRIEAIERHRIRMDNPRIPNGRDACLLKKMRD